jgi:hypothetical protein
MVAKFYLGNIKKSLPFFQPFRPCLPSKFVKSANMIKITIFFKNSICVNTKEFDAGFESEKKVAKICMHKKLSK